MTWICKNCESENPDTNKQCVVCNCLNATAEISPKILKIQYFKSSTNTGKVGDVIELSWSVFHASEIYITGIGNVKSRGKTEIKIPKFTNNKYQITLKAKNIRGTTIHQLITIKEEKIPQIFTFSSNKNSVTEGEQITLSWNVENASFVACSEISGRNLNYTNSVEVNISFNGAEEKTIFLCARQGEKVQTKSLTIKRIHALQILSFSSNKDNAEEGEDVMLYWNVENASWVTCSAIQNNLNCIGNRSINISFNGAEEKTIYLYAGNEKGERVKKSLVIKKISPIQILSFSSNKYNAEEGEEIMLSWNVKNASLITCSGFTYAIHEDNTNCINCRAIKISFNGAKQKIISIVARNEKGERVKKSLVIKKIFPIIASFYSNKNFANDNERITLYWEVKNADTITCSEMPTYTNLHPTDSMTINISFDGAEQKTISLYAKKGEEVQVKSLEIIKKLNISNRESDTGIASKLKNTSDISCKKHKKKDDILLSIAWLVSIASIPVASIPSTSFANTYHPRDLIINLVNMICAFLIGVAIKKIPSIGYFFNVISILFGIFFLVQIQLLGNSLIDQELNLLVNIFYMVFILIYGIIRITK